MEQRRILLNGKIGRSLNGFYETEVFINMKVTKSACSSSNPCSSFGNSSGCISNSQLKSVGIGDHKLQTDAANAFIKMYEDMPNNVKSSVKLSDSYRPLNIQCNIFDWDKYESSGKRVKKGTSSTPVAYPGTSNHGWGRAIDISPSNVQNWIRENGTKYGWCWGEAKSEPWHFTFCGPGPNRDKNCDSFCKGKITIDTTKPDSSDEEEIDLEKIDPKKIDMESLKKMLGKDSSMDAETMALDMFGLGDLKSWVDTMYGKGGESKLKDLIKLEESSKINEDVDRIKDIMKKIL